MLPRTEFYELGEHLMFLILNNRFFHIDNSGECKDNFLFASSLKFPLIEGSTLEETAKNYESVHAQALQEHKQRKIQKIQNLKEPLKNLQDDMDKNEFLVFYLENIQNSLNRAHSEITNNKEQNNEKQKTTKRPMLQDTLDKLNLKNIFVVNKRIFLLSEPDKFEREPFFILNGKKYYIAKTPYITDNIESIYQKQLEGKIDEEAIKEAPITAEIKNKIRKLKDRIRDLENLGGLRKKDFCYEFWGLGFDTEKNILYLTIPEFCNEYHKNKFYSDGQSAFGIPMIKKNSKISFKYDDADRKFLTREDENRGFCNAEWACIGFGNMSNRTYNPKNPHDFKEAVRFLQMGVATIKERKRHHIGVQY